MNENELGDFAEVAATIHERWNGKALRIRTGVARMADGTWRVIVKFDEDESPLVHPYAFEGEDAEERADAESRRLALWVRETAIGSGLKIRDAPPVAPTARTNGAVKRGRHRRKQKR